MASLTSYSDKQVLIIDDMSDMRSNLRSQVGSLSISNVNVAASIRDALDLIKTRRYDIILCDYYLAGSTDGQQFLEFLRTSNIISRGTLFIMITAETGYESVITAAECLPDDYLLKPFTAETLCTRVERMMERKARLAAIDKLQDKGAWLDIIKACDEIIVARDKYLIDAMRIKGNALLMSEQIDAAIAYYQDALKMRAMPWAKLGLAKAYDAKGEAEQAQATLNNLIHESPNLLSAYDLLGRILSEGGQAEKALGILDRACLVAPNSLNRHRNIASIAEHQGDFSRVERALNTVLKKTKNSPLRDPQDYARLSNAYTEMGQADKAIAVIVDAKQVFKDSGKDMRSVAAVEALAQQQAGKSELAQAALALAMQGDANILPQNLALTLAKACLACEQTSEAMGILKTLMQNNPDSSEMQARVTHLLKDHGGEQAAKELFERSALEVVQLNNAAVMRAKAGEYAAAAQMLTEAAMQLPNNTQVVANAAMALLVDVYMNGMSTEKIAQSRHFQAVVVKLNKHHPKLAEMDGLKQKIAAKYGSS